MTYAVGQKGQVVIAKEIRDRLGIGPGWVAVQHLAGNEVHIVFLPPEHDRSLRGSLQQYVQRAAVPADDWEAVQHRAWETAAQEQEGRCESRP